MIIDICSQAQAEEYASTAGRRVSVISITSTEEQSVDFRNSPCVDSVLHLKLNDLTEEYDEEGIPYGRPLPEQRDLDGLKAFADKLETERLIIHCWEGVSRSSAVAAGIYEYRGCVDTLRTTQCFVPNRRIYALVCRELGIHPGNLCYESIPCKGFSQLIHQGGGRK